MSSPECLVRDPGSQYRSSYEYGTHSIAIPPPLLLNPFRDRQFSLCLLINIVLWRDGNPIYKEQAGKIMRGTRGIFVI